jgi:CRP-like cAMP-binding protein
LGKYIFEKEIHITRNDLADYTNTSPDSVIRVLKDLTNENIIKLDGKFISITDYQRLEKISNSG